MDNAGFVGDDEDPSTRPRISSTKPSTTQICDEVPTKNSGGTGKEEARVQLQRTVGLFSACSLVVSNVIGSGIFVAPKGVLVGAGSVGLTLVIWVLCGIFSMMGSLCYAELGTIIPESGGTYLYILEFMAPNRRKEKSWWKELLPFLFQFQAVVFSNPAGLAVQCLVSATYLNKIFSATCGGPAEDSDTVIKIIAACLILPFGFINCYSVKWSITLTNIFSTAKVLALIFVILGGIVQLSSGQIGILSSGFEDTHATYKSISEAFFSGLYAYGGWEGLPVVAKEIINPKKNIPRALILSMILITVIYTFTNVAYFSVLNKNEFLASAAVAEAFGMKLLGVGGAIIMVLSVACSTSGTAIGGLFQSGRLAYQASKEGHMVDFLSFIHIKRLTPCPAIIYTMLSALLFVMVDLFSLIFLGGFLASFYLCVTMVALLRFRYTITEREGSIKVPLVIPLIVFIFFAFLTASPFVGKKVEIQYLVVLFVEVIFAVIYTIFHYYEVKLPTCMNFLRTITQKLLFVVPPEDD